MTHWSDRALRKLQERRKEKAVGDEVWLEKQRFKKAEGPALWDEVKKLVSEHVDGFNIGTGKPELFILNTESAELRVRSEVETHRRFLTAKFDEGTGRLEWNCAERKGIWKVAVIDGEARFQSETETARPDFVAEGMLNALLGFKTTDC